jgi:hypothetical protein
MTKLLEHPWVLAKRRELDAAVAAGRIVAYARLRWEADETGGVVHYTFQPLFPARYIKIDVAPLEVTP